MPDAATLIFLPMQELCGDAEMAKKEPIKEEELTGKILIGYYKRYSKSSEDGVWGRYWDMLMSKIDYSKVPHDETLKFIQFLEERIKADEPDAMALLATIRTRDAADALAKIVSGWSEDEVWNRVEKDYAPRIIGVLASRNVELQKQASIDDAKTAHRTVPTPEERGNVNWRDPKVRKLIRDRAKKGVSTDMIREGPTGELEYVDMTPRVGNRTKPGKQKATA